MTTKTSKKLSAFSHYQILQKWSKLFISIALLFSFTSYSFGQACTSSPACPSYPYETITSNGSSQWLETANLINNQSLVLVIPPGLLPTTYTPFFNADFILGTHTGRILQHTSGSSMYGTGNKFTFMGTALGSNLPGTNYSGLTSTWDNYRAVFGLIDNSNGPVRDGLVLWQDSSNINTTQKFRFVFRDKNKNDHDYLTILSLNGNVGINNVTNPLSKLEVSGGLYVGSGATVSAGSGQVFCNGGIAIGNDAFMGAASCSFCTQGWVGIGTNSPSAELHLKPNSYVPAIIAKFDYYDVAHTYQEAFRVDNTTGDIGINQPSPSEKLDVVGNVKVTGAINVSGNVAMNGGDITWVGNITTPSPSATHDIGSSSVWFNEMNATAFTIRSDKRLKREITNLNYGLKDLMNLRPVSYYYLQGKSKDKKRIGFIAQELKTIIPEAVFGEETDTSYLGICYSDIIPVLVNAIKEQQQQIEQAINSKNEYISALEKRIDVLENIVGKNNATNPNNSSGSILYQNEPNPFGGQTTIRFYIANNFSQAKIVITDNNSGATIKEIPINIAGTGNITVDASQLNSGSLYAYSLVVDGKIIDTKKMILLGR